jgi:beta-aspartyl-peptidase (threonine type)
VERVIRMLEDSGRFNAGRGANLQLDGIARRDAAIMDGDTLAAGAVAAVADVRHPITLARRVLERTPHVLIVGPPADALARALGLERAGAPPARSRRRLERARRPRAGSEPVLDLAERMARHFGTVGAVARDRYGRMAAGGSTGGVTRMLPGRVGDTPLVGAGLYADSRLGAVALTGIGEGIIRLVLGYRIVAGLAVAGPAAAVRAPFTELVRRIAGAAGAIVLDRRGRWTIAHTTPHLAAGVWTPAGVRVASRFLRVRG